MRNYREKFGVFWFFIFLSFFTQKTTAAPPLRIVGSSAVFPFAASVAEHFRYKTHEPTPIVEAIGTGAGVKLFCGSLKGPDAVITSRPFTIAEKKKCQTEDINFEEFTIGQDGLVLIQDKRDIPFSLTLNDLNLALAEKIFQDGACIKNTHKFWNTIGKEFPSYPIRVLGPAPTSGTYEVLIEKIVTSCGPHLRRDGAYIEAPANENLIVQKVLHTPQTIGIVTFSFYDQNKHRLNAFSVNGNFPSFESIQKRTYSLSRPLFLYIKTNDLSRHIARLNYVFEFLSQRANGEEGYLSEKGLIPLSPEEQETMLKRAQNLQMEIPS